MASCVKPWPIWNGRVIEPVHVPKDIAPEEELGRGVFSEKHKHRATRSRVPFHVFLEKPGKTEISVDRLRIAPPGEARTIADKVAAARKRAFHGWAFVIAERAVSNKRRVTASPLPDNPYHADIILPQLTADDREEQKRHAQELADASEWRGR